MFDKVRMICEGYADKRFLRDFIDIHYSVIINDEVLNENNLIRNIGSWTNLTKERVSITQVNSNYKTLIFLDADDETTKEKNGLKKTKEFVDSLMAGWNWTLYDVFVLPNNERETGSIEDLFENIINKHNEEIFTCWDDYENCIESYSKYKIPAKKSKIYTYTECMNALGNYDFKDTRLWDLNSPYLNPLKEFINNNIV
jgi:hypothetical protein